jgi:hypothetical protein
MERMTGSDGSATAYESRRIERSSSHSTAETTSPASSLEATARRTSRSSSMGLPAIEPDVSMTKVRFMGGRSPADMCPPTTPIWSA